MTGLYTLPAIRTGAAAESIRLMIRACTCPQRGPFPGAHPLVWQKAGTDEGCPVHGGEARARRNERKRREGGT